MPAPLNEDRYPGAFFRGRTMKPGARTGTQRHSRWIYRGRLGSRIKTARLRSGMQTGRWLADHRPRSTEGEGRSTGKL